MSRNRRLSPGRLIFARDGRVRSEHERTIRLNCKRAFRAKINTSFILNWPVAINRDRKTSSQECGRQSIREIQSYKPLRKDSAARVFFLAFRDCSSRARVITRQLARWILRPLKNDQWFYYGITFAGLRCLFCRVSKDNQWNYLVRSIFYRELG